MVRPQPTLSGLPSPTATALWVIQVLHCGASCAGYDAHVFSFHPSHIRYPPHSVEYDRATIREEIQRDLGDGGVKFVFPRLLLYVNMDTMNARRVGRD